jgi:fibronectin-binding autotransporter adhesin
MLTRGSYLLWLRLLLAAVACAVWVNVAAAQGTATWTGATSTDWATSTNWSGTAPVNGSNRTFIFGTAANQNTNNTLTGLTANGITFNTGGFDLAGNGVTLAQSINNTAGDNSISLGLTLSTTPSMTVASGTTLTVGGVISQTGGNRGLTADGPGTLVLNGANSYVGTTTISAGVVSVNTLADGGNNSSIGAATTAANNLQLNGGTLQYAGTGSSTNRLFSITNSSTIDASGSGAVNFTSTGTVTNNGSNVGQTLTLTGSNTNNNTLAVTIADGTGARTIALAKSGSGTWVLTGANTYSAGTTVSAGTLLVNNTSGSGTGGGAVTVQNGGTLGGTGTISGGAVTVQNGGTLAPGASAAVGTLHTATTTFSSGSTFAVDLNGSSSADQLASTGTLTFNSFTLALNNLGGTYNTTQNYTIATATTLVTSALTLPANFTVGGSQPGGGVTFSTTGFASGDMFSLSRSGNNLVLTYTPVPEAAALAVFAAGLGVVPVARRLRRRAVPA